MSYNDNDCSGARMHGHQHHGHHHTLNQRELLIIVATPLGIMYNSYNNPEQSPEQESCDIRSSISASSEHLVSFTVANSHGAELDRPQGLQVGALRPN